MTYREIEETVKFYFDNLRQKVEIEIDLQKELLLRELMERHESNKENK